MSQYPKALLLKTHRFHSCAKHSIAQINPEKELEEPFFGHETEQANQALQDKPSQPQKYLSFIPHEEVKQLDQQKRLVPCQYPGCQNKLDPWDWIKSIRDPKTNKFYCRSHTGVCDDCGEIVFRDKLIEYGGEKSCPKCYEKHYADCPFCHETVPKRTLLKPKGTEYGRIKNGACEECAVECSSCEKLVDKDSAIQEDNGVYCENCHSENFRMCDDCGRTTDPDDSHYIEGVGDICNRCYENKYTACERCGDVIETSQVFDFNGENYCEECFNKAGPAQYSRYTDKFQDFTYTKKDRYLNTVRKLLRNKDHATPNGVISIKELKGKHPAVAAGLADLISFSGGKPLNAEMVKAYRDSLNPEEFPVDYTVWSGLQRSIDKMKTFDVINPKDRPQLVMNIIASNEMLSQLKADPLGEKGGRALYNLFSSINKISEQSTHPFVKDQIGWARLEINPNNEYLLVDEIQCDHSNASFELKQANSKVWADINAVTTDLADRFLADKDDCISLMFVEGFDPNIQKEGREIYEHSQRDDESLGRSSYYALRDQFQKKHNLTDVAARELTKVVPALHIRFIGSKSNIFALVKQERERIKTKYSIDDEKLNSILMTNTPEEIKRIRDNLKSKYSLDDNELNKLLEQYSNILKDFPNIASQAITRFAQVNHIKKIYWHTYEGGMKLKENEPPKSLYDKVPKENFFRPTTEKPFGLDADFLEKEAKIRLLFKQANKLINKI